MVCVPFELCILSLHVEHFFRDLDDDLSVSMNMLASLFHWKTVEGLLDLDVDRSRFCNTAGIDF